MSQKGTENRAKLFNPQILDLEQIIYDMMLNINRAFSRVDDSGNFIRAEAAYVETIINLDTVFTSWIKNDGRIDASSYLKERKDIIKDWDRAPMQAANKLYGLIIGFMNRNRLMRSKRYTYFGIGMKTEDQLDVERLTTDDEEEEVAAE